MNILREASHRGEPWDRVSGAAPLTATFVHGRSRRTALYTTDGVRAERSFVASKPLGETKFIWTCRH